MSPQLAAHQEPVERRTLPIRALLDRLGSGSQALSWSCYLPEGLLQRAPSGCDSAGAGDVDPQGCFSLNNLLITGRVWSLSQEAHGCRQVQAALDAVTSDEVREALAIELRGHVLQACRCPHANHVLQKCISQLRPDAMGFVIEELLSGVVSQTARHKYGCRIVQRLVEHCRPCQVQVLLQHGTDDQRRRLVGFLAKEVHFLSSESCGCSVLSAALTHVPDEDRRALALGLLKEPGLPVFMACTRHGLGAVLRVLDLLRGEDREQASQRLQAEAGALRVSKYGRIVVEHLEMLESEVMRAACCGGA